MKKQLIITSLLTLSACVSTSGKIQNMIPTEIDGLKVYTNSEVKKCGIKDKDGDFMQRCDKKTDSFLNGIVYFRNDEKDEIREYIDYYKDGHKIKYITKKNGVVTQETNYTLDIKNNLLNFTGKDYFDNGALFCERSGSREYTAWEDITANRTCYYINGVLNNKYTMNRKDGEIDIDYDPKGNMIIKGVKPYIKNDKSYKDTGIEENMVDKWTRYDVNGNLYNGKVTYYFEDEPETVSLISSLKNGKKDGESYAFQKSKDLEKSDVKEWIYTYKDGIKVKNKTVFKDEKRNSFETYFIGDNEVRIDRNNEENHAHIICKYKGHNTVVSISGVAAIGFVKLFEKDTTKSLCPDVSEFIK